MFYYVESSPSVDEGAEITPIAKFNQNFPDSSQPQPHFVFLYITKCQKKVFHDSISIYYYDDDF